MCDTEHHFIDDEHNGHQVCIKCGLSTNILSTNILSTTNYFEDEHQFHYHDIDYIINHFALGSAIKTNSELLLKNIQANFKLNNRSIKTLSGAIIITTSLHFGVFIDELEMIDVCSCTQTQLQSSLKYVGEHFVPIFNYYESILHITTELGYTKKHILKVLNTNTPSTFKNTTPNVSVAVYIATHFKDVRFDELSYLCKININSIKKYIF